MHSLCSLEQADHRLAQPGAGLRKKYKKYTGLKATQHLIVNTIGAERNTRLIAAMHLLITAIGAFALLRYVSEFRR